jgi:hypothetical protein
MGIPTECKMPDLSGLDTLTNRLLVQVMIGDPGVGHKTALYRRNFVRLVDKALREYGEARKAILADIAEASRSAKGSGRNGRAMYFIVFTDHIETCVNAAARLFKLLERLKSEKDSPKWPQAIRKQLETASESVRNVRDAVEHMDQEIQKDGLTLGKPVMLTVSESNDAMVISKYELQFDLLAMVLKQMHEVAQYVLTIKKMKAE